MEKEEKEEKTPEELEELKKKRQKIFDEIQELRDSLDYEETEYTKEEMVQYLYHVFRREKVTELEKKLRQITDKIPMPEWGSDEYWKAMEYMNIGHRMLYPLFVSKISHDDFLHETGRMPEIGTMVKIRPVSGRGSDSTFLGVSIGEVPYGSYSSYNRGTGELRVQFQARNPTFYIPELKRIVFGFGSWWSPIESEEDIKEITNKTINNVWYVQAMKQLNNNSDHEGEMDHEHVMRKVSNWRMYMIMDDDKLIIPRECQKKNCNKRDTVVFYQNGSGSVQSMVSGNEDMMRSLVHVDYHQLIDEYSGEVETIDDNNGFKIYPYIEGSEYLFEVNTEGDARFVGDNMSILVNSRLPDDTKDALRSNQESTYWNEINIPVETVREIRDEFWDYVVKKQKETGFQIGFSHKSGDMWDYFQIIIPREKQREGDIDTLKEIHKDLKKMADRHHDILEDYSTRTRNGEFDTSDN